MQYRGFIQFALLLLACGCFVLGLVATLTSLIVFSLAIEVVVWTKILEQKQEMEQQGVAL